MTTSSTVQALADVAHALVENADLHDVLVHVLDDCRDVLAADAVGLMVQTRDHTLELLAATSHRSSELELYQVQTSEGPCPDVIRTGDPVIVAGATELRQRWPRIGVAILDAGYESVEAIPVQWHGQVLGGLNIFRVHGRPASADGSPARAFADMLALLLVRDVGLPVDAVAARIRTAIAGRTVIEQAKGVLAERLGVDPDETFDDLAAMAAQRDLTITAAAEEVVLDAQRATPPAPEEEETA